MVRNPERRAALVDAGVEVLAAEGARGLTFRAVDTAAGVPTGTSSNYFAHRDDLLHQIDAWLHRRLAPDPEAVGELLARPRDRALAVAFMHNLMGRVQRDRTGFLALMEMRLEASRRPDLRASLMTSLRGDLDEGIAFHAGAGLPGGPEEVTLLYLGMQGLILEHLTMPGLLDGAIPGAKVPEDVVTRLVERIIPER
ncbi:MULTISPECIES: TetR/AcrR family transcriptional regulator [unclassified Streptomyces]|uniref:TetR/AcrR family transcriptional regulator n=1 Tax=unclassified Streptomyces TaxID=2593676 RepID=UPI000DB9D58A|nr:MULTISPECIES: TetR/AcrR family transcriptional regulator [unclassified Streptomyces]MYT75861.1 TetR family transcriptional regulator [Streptomyces sp. SID8367]RAJ77689.1 TetR family transcriptional regulator [Streptomyces sp. PsTaAH-137]